MLEDYMGVSAVTLDNESPPVSPVQADGLAQMRLAPPYPPSLSPNPGLLNIENQENFLPETLAKNLRSYFFSARKNKEVHSQILTKNGEILDQTKIVALPPPQLSEFLRSIPLSLEAFATLYDENKIIRDAVMDCKMVLKEFLIENGLLGLYDANFAKYIANIELNMVASLGTVQVTHLKAASSSQIANRKYKKKINKALSFIENSNQLIAPHNSSNNNDEDDGDE